MMDDRSPFLVNQDDVEWSESSHGKAYQHRRKKLGEATRSQKLGCSLYEVQPGKKPFPFHYHFANEEAILVLQGLGTIRMNEGTFEIREGDYLTLPAGPAGSHQIQNNGRETLRFYVISTMQHPDICVYPDTKKYGLFAGSAPGGPVAKRLLSEFVDGNAKVDYWDGEE